ncbi:MAG TPA: hypothetical protein VJ867_10545 [Gemmatimonadaceae bacterium]|nr:hypothetical protein [Gemmatimonadaceae bacterium]
MAVDNRPLPVTLRYNGESCVVTGGSFALYDEVGDFGDGRIEWTVRGSVTRLLSTSRDEEQLFWWGEEFDRLDARHVTFPGGWRKQRNSGTYVLTEEDVGMQVAPMVTDVAPPAQQVFGARVWRFAATSVAATADDSAT